MGQNLQKWASIRPNGSKWAIFSEIHNTICTIGSHLFKMGLNWPKWLKMGQIAQLIIIILSVFTYQFNGPKFAKMGFK